MPCLRTAAIAKLPQGLFRPVGLTGEAGAANLPNIIAGDALLIAVLVLVIFGGY
jgi:hypothetical protein